jgi:hypothetical protein
MQNLTRILIAAGFERTATGGGEYLYTRTIHGWTISLTDPETMITNQAEIRRDADGVRFVAGWSGTSSDDHCTVFPTDYAGLDMVVALRMNQSLDHDGLKWSPTESQDQITRDRHFLDHLISCVEALRRGLPHHDGELQTEKTARRRASALVTLLRCIDQGEASIDCGLGVELLDTDRDLAARLLDWIGEDEASTIENWNP